MTMILVCYQGEPIALAGARDTHLLGQLASAAVGDPDARFALYMVYYAQLIACGQHPGPYTEQDAQRFARAALIDPGQLARHTGQDDARLAARLHLPEAQIHAGRHELKAAGRPGQR